LLTCLSQLYTPPSHVLHQLIATMTTTVTLLYPTAKDGKAFDESYYISSHMPLVHSKWSTKGLTSWHVTHLDPSTGYVQQCTMFWESEEKMKECMGGPEAKQIMDDIVNYSSVAPVTLVGAEISRS